MNSAKTKKESTKKGPTEPDQTSQISKAIRDKIDHTNNAVWNLRIQFEFELPNAIEQGVGKLVLNHRKRHADLFLITPLTGYPQFVRNLITMETVGDVDLKKLLDFFTTLNNSVPSETHHL